MKLIFVFVLLFGAYYRYVISNDCGSLAYGGHWICSRNGNSKLNATYDCKLNNRTAAGEWMWSPAFPDEMDLLTFQNCDKLWLNTKFPPKIELNSSHRLNPKNYFQYLHVVNVSLLSINNNLFDNWRDYRKVSYENDSLPEYYNRSCSLKHLIIENVQKLEITNFFHDCFIRNGKFKSLKLFNVNIDKLNIKDLKLEELMMENVTIHEAEPNVFRLNGSGAVKITNSHFTKIKNDFVIGNTNEVAMSNNSFGKLYGKVFALDAEKITLDNNNIEAVLDDSLSLTSNNIQIVNNIFHNVDQNAFRSISGRKPEFKSFKSYNFSNNVIYSLAKGALNISPQNNNQKFFFHELIIANNEINCVCDNVYWFDSVAKKKDEIEQYRFYSKWAKNSYNNKCLNFPNCSISQVLKNYKELCNDHYDCLDEQNDFMEQERISKIFSNYSVELNRNISELFQILIDRVENNSLNKLEKDDRMKNYFIGSDKNFHETQEEISDLRSDVNVNQICLFVITILFCLMFIFFTLAKCLKLPFFNALISKFGAKRNTVVIEANDDSSVTELMNFTKS